jgi:hypothetical protein
MTLKANNTFQIQTFTKQLEQLTRVIKNLKDDMASMQQHISGVDQRRFNMSKRNRGYKFQIFMIIMRARLDDLQRVIKKLLKNVKI